MKNDVIYLITTTETTDADGFPVITETKYMVMADIKSVKRSEYYQATAMGITASIVAVVNKIDYDLVGKPKLVEYDSTRYKIIRTYFTDKNSLELTLSEVE